LGDVRVPIYEYTCKSCETKFEKLVRAMSSATDGEKVKCPDCGSVKTARSFSVFAVGAEGAKSSGASAPASGMCGCGRVPGTCGMG
jgi:putative FmdB family regulatory protein